MDFWNLANGIIFLLQTTIGILGNFSLIFYYLILYYRQCTLKPTDLILMHIMVANALIILSFGVPHTMAAFGLKPFLNDLACRLLVYTQVLGRSVSISTTCLLSVFQAMTISPRESCWKDHKARSARYIGCSISILWVISILTTFLSCAHTFITVNSKNITRKRDLGYCSSVEHNEISDPLYTALIVCPEIFLSVLIVWCSMSMVLFLYRHKQRVQHIRSTRGSSRTSPDARATQNILGLVSTFMVFYTVSSILHGCISLLYNHNWWLPTINRVICLCFPSFAPFVLMNPSSILSRFIKSG
ncbi:vomeronasal type-1 receptor 4-like [Acomys russatus]|uniref:vomeronasal type-1 receptor 4-like n=1 Tax=Acomys russatus TaxID=60746 RepID=UPI0021E2D36D|nr:vomeronasal type-1 receptor 4-like [Acomys russatus]